MDIPVPTLEVGDSVYLIYNDIDNETQKITYHLDTGTISSYTIKIDTTDIVAEEVLPSHISYLIDPGEDRSDVTLLESQYNKLLFEVQGQAVSSFEALKNIIDNGNTSEIEFINHLP